jgi:hypothetical protein
MLAGAATPANVRDAARAMIVLRVLVLSIWCASWAKWFVETMLAPDGAAGKGP